MKKYIAIIAAILLASAFGAITAFASDYTVITDFDEKSSITWTPKDAVSGITVVKDIDINQNRGKVLSAEGALEDASAIRSIVAEFERPLDLSDYKSLSVCVFIDPVSMHDNNDCFLRIIFNSSSGKQHESIIALKAGTWEKVCADISSYSHRSSISSIELGVVPNHVEIAQWGGGFMLDEIAACDKIDTSLSDRFSFEKYSVRGASMSFAGDKTYFDLEADDSTDSVILEFDVAAIIKPDSNSLRIALENRCNASVIKVSLMRAGSTEEDVLIAGLPKSEDFTVINIDARRPSDVESIRLEFVAEEGSMRIHGIEFASVYGRDSYVTYGEVSRCVLSDDAKNIIISGKIPRSTVSAYADATLLLYSLNLNENARDYDYSSAEPIASHGMSTKFRFSIPADKSELKKYVVMISAPYMLFVDTPSYAESDIIPYQSSSLDVGLYNASDDGIFESTASAAVVDVYIDKMLSSDLSGYLINIENSRYYFERSYIDSIDKTINAYKAAGATISLRLLIGSDQHSDIVFAKSDFNGANYFPNIKTDAGYSKMRACVEFLSERYLSKKSKAGVKSFVIGKAVNAGDENFYTEASSITDFVASYAELMRFVYSYSKNRLPEVRVYASFGDVYEYSSYENVSNRFDTKLFLQALYTHITDEGIFPFGICIDSFSVDNSHNKILSASDISSLDMLFATQSLKNEDLPVIFVDNIVRTNLSDTDVDSCVLSRLIDMAEYGKVSSYITDCDNNLSYSNRISSVIKAFLSNDTQKLSSLGINIEEYDELVSKGKIHTKSTSFCDAIYSLPFKPIGKYSYFSMDSYSSVDRMLPVYGSGEVKFSPARSGKRYLTISADESGADNTAQAFLGAVLFFENSINFTYTPLIAFDLSVSEIESTESIPLTLRFTGENHIHDVYAALEHGESQIIYADLSEYKDNLFDSVQILIKEAYSDSMILNIGSIEGFSGIYSDTELSELAASLTETDKSQSRLDPAVISGFIIVLTALSTITLLLYFKLRKNENDV